jgi:hypothetical protein
MAISYKNIYLKVIYVYFLWKYFLKTNLFIWFSNFWTQGRKSFSRFIFSMFDSNIAQNNF